jgi:hypothetical protein
MDSDFYSRLYESLAACCRNRHCVQSRNLPAKGSLTYATAMTNHDGLPLSSVGWQTCVSMNTYPTANEKYIRGPENMQRTKWSEHVAGMRSLYSRSSKSGNSKQTYALTSIDIRVLSLSGVNRNVLSCNHFFGVPGGVITQYSSACSLRSEIWSIAPPNRLTGMES